MSTVVAATLRFLEFLLISVWVGGITVLSSLVAPTLFTKLPTRAQAGEMFGHILTRFYVLEIALGLILLSVGLLRWKYYATSMGFTVARTIVIVLMLGASLAAQFYVRPQLKELRIKIGDFEKTSPQDPNRVAFGKLHQQSVMLMTFNLFGGIFVLLLLLWRP